MLVCMFLTESQWRVLGCPKRKTFFFFSLSEHRRLAPKGEVGVLASFLVLRNGNFIAYNVRDIRSFDPSKIRASTAVRGVRIFRDGAKFGRNEVQPSEVA